MNTDAKIYIAGHRGLVGSASRKLPDVSCLHGRGWRHKHPMPEGLLAAYRGFVNMTQSTR